MKNLETVLKITYKNIDDSGEIEKVFPEIYNDYLLEDINKRYKNVDVEIISNNIINTD